MSEVVFLAFANSENEKLDTLMEESKKVSESLQDYYKGSTTQIIREEMATRDKIIKGLNKHKDNIIVFQFSGHAIRDKLILEDGDVKIDHLLSLCPKLQLVILNGCATREQSQAIFNQKYNSDPVIISTNAPVQDASATKYSISFWEGLCAGRAYLEAHEAAIAGVLSIKKVDHSTHRLEASIEELEKMSGPLWDFSTKSESTATNTLPKGAALPREKEVNKILLKVLLEAYAPLQPAVKEALTMDQTLIDREKLNSSIEKESYQKTMVLEALPHPISEQMRKLFAVKGASSDRDHIFFTDLSSRRIGQIINTYQVLIELIAFIFIGQIWQLTLKKEISKSQIPNELKTFFELRLSKRKDFSFIKLIYDLNNTLLESKKTNFINEWNDPKNNLEKDTKFNAAIDFMRKTKNELATYAGEEISRKCKQAEEHLATFYAKLAFITNYKMTSVRTIGFLSYGHYKKPKFKHAFVELIQKLRGIDLDPSEQKKVFEEAKYTSTVILERKDGVYVNLSPFIIDGNAFDDDLENEAQTKEEHKKQFAKLYHFVNYEPVDDEEKFTFYHVYRPGDNKLGIKNQAQFDIVKDQFQNFKQEVLNFTPNK